MAHTRRVVDGVPAASMRDGNQLLAMDPTAFYAQQPVFHGDLLIGLEGTVLSQRALGNPGPTLVISCPRDGEQWPGVPGFLQRGVTSCVRTNLTLLQPWIDFKSIPAG